MQGGTELFSALSWAEGYLVSHFHAGPWSHCQAHGIPALLRSGRGGGSHVGPCPGELWPGTHVWFCGRSSRFCLESGFWMLDCYWGPAPVCSGRA